MQKINNILKRYNIDQSKVFNYGEYIAKLDTSLIKPNKNSKLILVTASNPSPAGEGKTTTSIGLNDAFNLLGKNSIVCLREPSIGPYFGVKGGATGGNKSSILPVDEINMHFTGDFHALTTANNLIAACIDNTIYWDNPLNIDVNKIIFKRAVDMNDRSLRDITVEIKKDLTYKTSFDITAAIELMTIYCLAKNKEDFRKRMDSITVAYTKDNKPVTVKQLNITNALMKVMEHAFNPNAVQTMDGNLAIVQGGPFANISVGVNTYMATKLSLSIADYVVTEAGFGSDLGGEKFLDIICQENKIIPSCAVVVTSIRGLLYQGGDDLSKGLENLKQHATHMKNQGVPFVIAINKFDKDTKQQLDVLENYIKQNNWKYAITTGYSDGAQGGVELAKKVMEVCSKPSKTPKFLYKKEDSLKTKINNICKKCYGIDKIEFSVNALEKMKTLDKYKGFYLCISKTPLSLQTSIKGGQKIIFIDDFIVNTGSKLIIALTEKVFRMPGLPKKPKAEDF